MAKYRGKLDEDSYQMGERAVHLADLRRAMRELRAMEIPEDQELLKSARCVLERAETVQTLRSICQTFGDNEWEDEQYLPDVLDKHLAKWLHE